ncbi:helix-turn-helix domain-containing protein [Granulicoccus phenolivorans]|uniref:helix-turn-helix domain-containing protein n=1 Tax=Granulicoccus phenolivorans TaxID=266854 RepID=UPI000411949D|nr:helix-turn-helix transcriptional regulator [Granulicoccus phenolivorans]
MTEQTAPARAETPQPVRPTTPPRSPREPEPLWRHLLGNHLRARRAERGDTLGEVAARAGISPQYLSEIERGRKEPSSEMIAAVSEALDTTLLDLTLDVARSLTVSSPVPAGATRADFTLAA